MNRVKQYEGNIDYWLNKASSGDWSAGASWYNRAYNEAHLMCKVFKYPIQKAIGVIAALSPRNKWYRNLQDAWDLLESPSMDTKVCTFDTNKMKAIKIIKGTDSIEDIQKILNGRKTVSFFRNIMGYTDTVTVDVWAFRSVFEEPKQSLYNDVEQAYLNVAKRFDLPAHVVQAIVWVVVRREWKNIKPVQSLQVGIVNQ